MIEGFDYYLKNDLVKKKSPDIGEADFLINRKVYKYLKIGNELPKNR